MSDGRTGFLRSPCGREVCSRHRDPLKIERRFKVFSDMPTPLSRHLSLRSHLQVVHHVPGRLRLRFNRPAGRAAIDIAGLKAFLEDVRAVPAIISVRLSPATLSAIIEYDPKVLRPPFWSTLLSGPDDEAHAALSALTGRTDADKE